MHGEAVVLGVGHQGEQEKVNNARVGEQSCCCGGGSYIDLGLNYYD